MTRLPAVSAPNGKVEVSGGWVGMNGQPSSVDLRGGASVSFPVNDIFGIQADIAAANAFSDTKYGGALHMFTRDPNAYLLGAAGGAFWSSNTNAQFVGPEAEAYIGNVSLEAFAGYMNLNLAGVSSAKFFGFGDVAYYPAENLRLNFGVSDVADFKSAHVQAEYQISDTQPISLTLAGKVGDNSFVGVDAGLKIYFGASSKSLIRRHREDDPRNRILDVFGGAGNGLIPPPVPPVVTPPVTDPCALNPLNC